MFLKTDRAEAEEDDGWERQGGPHGLGFWEDWCSGPHVQGKSLKAARKAKKRAEHVRKMPKPAQAVL